MEVLQLMPLLGSFVLFLQARLSYADIQAEDSSYIYKRSYMPKGTPFGKIKGPSSKDDRIAIVGAGASGIHMAYKLKSLGFKHVTVFEQSGRIGGKSYTVYHRGVPQEMGTCYTSPDYGEIYNLINEFDAGEILNMPEATMWLKEGGSYDQMSSAEFIVKTVNEVKGITNPVAAFQYFQQALGRYVALHLSLFGTYEGELMPRPSAETMANISCTFLEFLIRHDLEVLKAIFIPAQTVQGYGQLDEIPALYGLMWSTPNLLNGILTSTPDNRAIKILDKGFQFLWQEIARQRSLDIRLYHEVVDIKRIKKGSKYVIDVSFNKFNCQRIKQRFDFLIITPTMKTMLKHMDYRAKEARLFSPTYQQYFTTTLLDTDYGVNRPPTPTSFFISDVLRKINNLGGWALRDSFSSLNNEIGLNYSSGGIPGGPDGKFVQSSIFYQMSTEKQRPNVIKRRLTRYIKRVLKMNVIGDPIEQTIWPYFSRYSEENLADGVLWNIYDMQGKYNTWYIGASVCFESVKSVVEYNLLLLRNYDVPN